MNTIVGAAAIAIAVASGAALEQESAPGADTPVVTVCEALNDLSRFNGVAIVAVGKLASTDEGKWLSQTCATDIVTNGYKWVNTISLTYERGGVRPPPELPKTFSWEQAIVSLKLKQVQETTKLEVLPQYNYTDKWFAIFGRFETRVPPRVARGGDDKMHGGGFGHLNLAPAQLISYDSAWRELKPNSPHSR